MAPSTTRRATDFKSSAWGRRWWVGTGLAVEAACACPPSYNPPCEFLATGSPGCTHGVQVIPSYEVPTPHEGVRTRVAFGDRTSEAGAADCVVSTCGPIGVVLPAGPRRASAYSGVIRNTGRSRAASSSVAFADPAASNAYVA